MFFQIGQRVSHKQYGDGIVISLQEHGFTRVFFPSGERLVPSTTLSLILSREEQVINNVNVGILRNKEAWLTYKAHALPLIDGATALTSAQIDLLPHQVVLTHRIATSFPRRFLIADEVGLGKTIETALILRELMSRGELKRALMVVPAGLVNNWHRELNEVFNLNFEVFGSEGDVTDRKTNAFAKHDKLIVSIDTLKVKARMNRLKEAPGWDLVVFDEAHHMSAYKNGNKVKKTENYKLGELLREHTRDIILLSATPHQGDNFRFKMLINLLNPTLFTDIEDMINNRHRLNSIMFRRTKADACRADGSMLFARRLVNTESFIMSEEERVFYRKLVEYLAEGFAISQQLGGKGGSLGLIMSVFQKIAASSFAAIKRTLKKRLLALTIQEGIAYDERLYIEKREEVFEEAREIIREEYSLGSDRIANLEVENILNEYKRKILKKISEEELEYISDESVTEKIIANAEENLATLVFYQIPEERKKVKELLTYFSKITETKVLKIITALGYLWRNNKDEKIVIFATYIGTVDMLEREINKVYPGQGVVVLKGGDHNSKAVAEKKFKKNDGPRVMICTAAGREGINLQFSRILFNFDLPWNPMDIEQRIGRIHRYGQKDTAQVYNLVLSDTIEGKIFLLLEEKLNEIAKTLGKVDNKGNLAENLKPQILGQLSERLNYEQLYKNALNDHNLIRTKAELEAAMLNANEARKVVNDLFQDLDEFNLDDYKPFSNLEDSIDQIANFIQLAAECDSKRFIREGDSVYSLVDTHNFSIKYTSKRDIAINEEGISLLGLDDPIIIKYINKYKNISPDKIGIRVTSADGETGVLSIWFIEVFENNKEIKNFVIPLGINNSGTRVIRWEKNIDNLYSMPPASNILERSSYKVLYDQIMAMLQREMLFKGIITEDSNYSVSLIGWIEVYKELIGDSRKEKVN